jgi:hypothetical protein
MMKRFATILFLNLITIGACGGSDGAGPDAAGGAVTCTATANITPDLTAKTMTGSGKITCDGVASLEVQTCVQWNPSGTFVDIICMSSTKSGTAALQVDNLSSCGIAVGGRMYRARVATSANGITQAEQLSAAVPCQ